MESGNKVRFRVTQWPGMPVPIPPVFVPEVVELLDDKTLVFGYQGSFYDDVEVHVPPELYLRRFMGLDVSRPNEVLDFCRRYGEVGWDDWRDLPGEVRLRAGGRPAEYRLPPEWAGCSVDSVRTVEEVGLYQSAMRDMICLWQYVRGESTMDELLGSLVWPSLIPSNNPPRSAESQLIMGLNAGLGPFHVRVVGSYDVGEPMPNIYEAMCLQLANHIAESAEYRRCKAEGCGQLFVRQQGRAKHDQHRVRGVLNFCSDTCANRQHQRELRRRKAAAKRQAGGTTPPDTSTEGSTP